MFENKRKYILNGVNSRKCIFVGIKNIFETRKIVSTNQI